MKTAYATIMGFEVMRALRKGQAAIFNLSRDIRGEARIVERAFGIGASALAEAAAMITEQLEFNRPDARMQPYPPGMPLSVPTFCNRANENTFGCRSNEFPVHVEIFRNDEGLVQILQKPVLKFNFERIGLVRSVQIAGT